MLCGSKTFKYHRLFFFFATKNDITPRLKSSFGGENAAFQDKSGRCFQVVVCSCKPPKENAIPLILKRASENIFRFMKHRKKLVLAWQVLIFLTLVVTLIHYKVSYASDYFSIDDFLNNPARYDGQKKGIKGIYDHSFEGGFFMIKNHQKIKIYFDGRYDPPAFGEVLIYGTLQRDGSVAAEAVHNYNYAYFTIYGSSFLAGLAVLLFFLREWKITFGGLQSA